ncbi:heat shock factor protein 5-like [Calypte anna]|uniref:heat shock factor protein 5-like n=1 Tax=Calypte anna TaxID=9244 RepID=UPI0011C38DC5|nr:heat shock factor protein 5-like [Calypte anna]
MEEPRLPSPIDPHTFPAKLWRLVNSPRCGSVRWDARGEGLLIDQALFERELLGTGPCLAAGPGGDSAEVFKTKNFSSLVRQLNLYGFRKVMAGPAGSGAGSGAGPGPKGDGGAGGSSSGPLHHFHSPHFHRGRPDLLTQMKRLTRANRAKLAAGLQASSRPATRIQRLMGSVLSPDLLPKANGLGETWWGVRGRRGLQKRWLVWGWNRRSPEEQGSPVLPLATRFPLCREEAVGPLNHRLPCSSQSSCAGSAQGSRGD